MLIELEDDEVAALERFRTNPEILAVLASSGALRVQDGSITLHFSGGKVMSVEVKEIAWKRLTTA